MRTKKFRPQMWKGVKRSIFQMTNDSLNSHTGMIMMGNCRIANKGTITFEQARARNNRIAKQVRGVV